MGKLRDRWYVVIDAVTGEIVQQRHEQVVVSPRKQVPLDWPDDLRLPGTIWGFSTVSEADALRTAREGLQKGDSI